MKLIIKLYVGISLLGLLSCSNEAETSVSSDTLNPDPANITSTISQEVLDEMMQSLPQPIEIAQIISTSKIEISKDILIPGNAVDNMQNKYSQALSFGAYGVDLGYINLNGKSMYMIEYLESVKKLSQKLKVDQFFDFQTLSQLARNKTNADSLVQISTENFNKIDVYLREHNRGELSVLILAGAWIEGMNMFCEIYKRSPTPDISNRICEQQVVFNNIYLILDKLSNAEYCKNMQTSFLPLKSAYDKVVVSYKFKEPIMKEVNGQLVLKDQTETIVEAKKQDIETIVKELQNLRDEYFILNKNSK